MIGRRFSFSAVAFCAMLLLYALYNQNNVPDSRRLSEKVYGSFKTRREPVSIVVAESGGSHDEVLAALVYSFASYPKANFTLQMANPRYNITGLIQEFDLPNQPIIPRHPWSGHPSKEIYFESDPDVLVLTTCETDLVHYDMFIKRFMNSPLRKTMIYCVVHHGERWNGWLKEFAKPLIEAELITFITLSRHVKRFFEFNATSTWYTKAKARVEVHVPVFPVRLPRAHEDLMTAAQLEGQLSFALQGDFSSERRDYKGIFQQLGKFLSKSEKSLHMHIIGHGNRPKVPDEVKDAVRFDESVSYGDFYSIIFRQLALLPAFASREYLDRKASSSMPAALIAHTPILANREILLAYDYLNEDDVYLEEQLGIGFDAIEKIIQLPTAEREAKKNKVKRKAEMIWMENQRMVKMWIDEWLERRKYLQRDVEK